jgi:tetratricopeptide (TPR) repeat protein
MDRRFLLNISIKPNLAAIILAALVFAGSPFMAEFGYQQAALQAEETTQKKQKTRRVPSMSETVYKKLGAGQEAIDLKDYALALETINDALGRSKRYNENEVANLHNMRGYIYYLQDNYAGAIREYKRVAAAGEKIPEGLETTTLYTIAQLSYVQENYDDALKYMEIWISKAINPSAAPRIFLATVYYQKKEYDLAVEQMELGIQIAKERGTTITEQNWSLLTFLYFEKEDWPKVIATLEIMVEAFPKREHWVRLAGVYGQEGFEKKQMYALEAAYTAGFLEKTTDFTNLAGLLMQDEVPYRAAKVLVAGMKAESVERSAKHLRSLGQAWQLAQEIDSAIEIFEEAAKISDDGKIYERLSYLYLEDDQFDRCVDAASGALDKGGLRKTQSVHIVKGMCLYNQNKLTTARRSFSSCRRVARDDDDKANQRICGQWITFIDREAKRQAQLAAASG